MTQETAAIPPGSPPSLLIAATEDAVGGRLAVIAIGVVMALGLLSTSISVAIDSVTSNL